MTASEYIAGFFLFIIGFAVSELLSGSARLLRDRQRIKSFWLYLIVVPLVFEILIFWFLWIFTVVTDGTNESWSVLELLRVTIQVIPWAFVSYLIFPTQIGEQFDAKQFLLENGKAVIVIVIFLNAFVIVDMIRTGLYQGMSVLFVSLAINILVLINMKKAFVAWLIANILLVNFFIFFAKPIVIG